MAVGTLPAPLGAASGADAPAAPSTATVSALPTSPEAYDPSGPAPTFDPLSGGAFPFAEHVPRFGLPGYGENGGAPTDGAAAGTATAETIESANVAASAVVATLMLAAPPPAGLGRAVSAAR